MWFMLKKKVFKFIIILFKKVGLRIERYKKPSYIDIIEENNVSLIFDVGANSGQFAKTLRENKFKKKIISFEPTKKAYHKLVKSSLNDDFWIVHPRVAIGNKIGQTKINVAANNGESSSILEMGSIHKESAPHSVYVDEETVDLITIDSIFDNYAKKDDNIMLKIDVQGYEDQVLVGAKDNINKIKLIKLELSLVNLYEGDKLFNFYFSKLQDLGYKIWDLEPGHRKSYSGRLFQFDALFVRDN